MLPSPYFEIQLIVHGYASLMCEIQNGKLAKGQWRFE